MASISAPERWVGLSCEDLQVSLLENVSPLPLVPGESGRFPVSLSDSEEGQRTSRRTFPFETVPEEEQKRCSPSSCVYTNTELLLLHPGQERAQDSGTHTQSQAPTT